ncbi:histidine kinase [Halarcobacter mediterraneus]|uniref:histidine kinase n=1 Tax=Halarcobacter mediterraneus TaxID=2023153 RepID=A0A4Q1AWS2_9BACT|nr:sensor histidine kinase [Halarcobacter mediterraneus]RXK14525.1 histidine kinase [Halarcobacter mediterraneus]
MSKMIKLPIYIFLILNFLNADIIKSIEILTPTKSYSNLEDIKKSKDFKTINLPVIISTKDNHYLKISLDNTQLNNQNKILEFNKEVELLEFNKSIHISSLNKDSIIEYSMNSPYNILFLKIPIDINNKDFLNYTDFDINIYEKNEFISKQMFLNKLYGVAYGIVFAAFLYYLALYIFNKEKSYIFYSLTQLSMLFILFSVLSKELSSNKTMMDIILFSFFLFSNLFTQHFLNTKYKSPKIHFILKLSIYIFIINLLSGHLFNFYFFEESAPLSSLLVIYIIAAIRCYEKNNFPILFYLLAWSLLILSFLFIQLEFYFIQKGITINPSLLMHFISPLESLILAFALSYKMSILKKEKNEQKELLLHQSKLASMGEMISNIAHQWRQPLTHISYIFMNLKTSFEKDRLTQEYFYKKTNEATMQLNFMSETIDDFRNFFKVTKQKENFSINNAINEVIQLLSGILKTNNITVSLNASEEIIIQSYKGEFLQVLFNILNNAKDELIEKNKKNANIKINLQKNKEITIQIIDNAGGIKKEILDKIFEPYFTTKDKGLGIGLYMSKTIIENHMNGKLNVKNNEDGAIFSIILP